MVKVEPGEEGESTDTGIQDLHSMRNFVNKRGCPEMADREGRCLVSRNEGYGKLPS